MSLYKVCAYLLIGMGILLFVLCLIAFVFHYIEGRSEISSDKADFIDIIVNVISVLFNIEVIFLVAFSIVCIVRYFVS